MGYGTARCVDRLKILSCFAWNACTDYSYYVSIIPCASWLQNYRLTSMWRWAMVRSFHVSIHPRLCGFSPSLHVTLMCVHVSQVLDQMVQESSTGWLSKIIHKWRVVVFRLVEYGQRKLSVKKLPSHRLEEKQNQSLRSNPRSMFYPNKKDFRPTCPLHVGQIFAVIQTGNSIFRNLCRWVAKSKLYKVKKERNWERLQASPSQLSDTYLHLKAIMQCQAVWFLLKLR